MKNDIFEALGDIDRKYISESRPNNKKSKGTITKILIPIAAAFAIVVAVSAGAAMAKGPSKNNDPYVFDGITGSEERTKDIDNVTNNVTDINKNNDPPQQNDTGTDGTKGEDDNPYTGNDPSNVIKALASPAYPTMVKYNGNNTNEWFESKIRNIGYFDSEESIDDYVKKTVGAFLADVGENENRVYSPLNVYFGLAMLAEVTEGETRAQILDLLSVSDIEALREQVFNLWNANYFDDGTAASILANSLWLSNQYEYDPETLDTLAEKYFASSFSGEPGSEEYDAKLHEWLNEQTGGLLEDTVNGVKLDPGTVLALASTIYYYVGWQAEFSEENNTEDIFHGAGGDSTVTFMHDTMENEYYYWSENFSATRKRLVECGYMYFILPDEGVTVNELLKDDNVLDFIVGDDLWNIHTWENKKNIIVNISLPKFDVSSELELSDILPALGVTDCFNPLLSDFTPLTDSGDPVFVNSIEHGARVKIDENGIEASALHVEVDHGCPDPLDEFIEVDFTLDRPFIFLVTGMDGNLLFTGVVNSVQ